MTSNRFRVLLKALWILLKLTLRIVIEVIVCGTLADIARGILLSIDAVGDFIPEQRELAPNHTIVSLIIIIYTCKLLIQIIIWIKYTAISLINKSDKPIKERFSPKHNKSAELITRRVIACFIDTIVLLLITKTIMKTKYSIGIYYSVLYCTALVAEGMYFIYFDQSKKGSPGKRLLGLKVIDENGNRLLIKASLIRFLYLFCAPLPFRLIKLYNLSSIGPDLANSFSIGLDLFNFSWFAVWLIPVFFTKKKTTLYDILSKTSVVRTSQ